jgi:hypothetical protein
MDMAANCARMGPRVGCVMKSQEPWGGFGRCGRLAGWLADSFGRSQRIMPRLRGVCCTTTTVCVGQVVEWGGVHSTCTDALYRCKTVRGRTGICSKQAGETGGTILDAYWKVERAVKAKA